MKRGILAVLCLAALASADAIPAPCGGTSLKGTFTTKVLVLRKVRLNGSLLDSSQWKQIRGVTPSSAITYPFAHWKEVPLKGESVDGEGRLSTFEWQEPVAGTQVSFKRIGL